MSVRQQQTRAYRVVIGVAAPIMNRWARLTVTGLDALPASGPTLIVADHDSYWDPLAIAVAARDRRQIHALSKSTLWKNKVVGAFMTGMGHIPVERGVSNDAAMSAAVDALRSGACIGIFPEATRSLGRSLRARSGVGRLAQLVPATTVVCVRTNGSTDVVRFPKGPQVDVEFFRPTTGPIGADEDAAAYSQRLVDEIRVGAPLEIPGRAKTAVKFRAALKENG